MIVTIRVIRFFGCLDGISQLCYDNSNSQNVQIVYNIRKARTEELRIIKGMKNDKKKGISRIPDSEESYK